MFTKQDIQRLRETTDDDSIFNYMNKSDAGFREKVRNVRTANPNMSALEEANFAKSMIDIHFGIKAEEPLVPETTQMVSSVMELQPPEEPTGSFVGRTIRNIPGSAKEFAGALFEAVRHPFQTAGALADVAVGGAANTIETVACLLYTSPSPRD